MQLNAFLFELQMPLTVFHRWMSLLDGNNLWTGSQSKTNLSNKTSIYPATVDRDGP